jgi:hypothetical protein
MNDNRIDVSCVVIYACGAIAREAPRPARASDGTHKKRRHSLCAVCVDIRTCRKKTQPQN